MTIEPMIVAVAAVARHGVIGRDNGMPWSLPTDLKHYKALTMGKPMVMGRKTFQSIGKPLPGRASIVVTRDAGFAHEGVQVVASIGAGVALGREIATRDGVDAVIIAGGGEIYAQAMPFVDRIVLTEIDLEVEGPVRFPELDPAVWRVVERVAGIRGARDMADFAFVTYERI